MAAREEFLGRVGKALGRSGAPTAPQPLTWRHTVHTDVMKGWSADELAREFAAYSRTLDAAVFETEKGALSETVRRALEGCGPGDVIVADDPLLRGLNTDPDLSVGRTVRAWDARKSWEGNVPFAERAAVGIAVAEMALAESGTVLLFSQKGCGRLLTLLPESTVYVIPKSRIRPRLTQGMAFLRENRDRLPSSVNFVSGPSSTSDIELVRVVGVHGPVHVVHIIVTDI